MHDLTANDRSFEHELVQWYAQAREQSPGACDWDNRVSFEQLNENLADGRVLMLRMYKPELDGMNLKAVHVG